MIIELFISYTVVILSQLIYVLSYKKLTNNKLNLTIPKIIFIGITSIIAMINSLYNIYSYKVLIGYLIIYFICKIWFKESNKKTFYYSFALTIMYMLIEIIFCFCILSFETIEELNNSLYAKNALTIIMTTSTYFLIMIPFIKKLINKIGEIVISKTSNEFLLIILLIVVNLLSMQFGFNYKNNSFFIVSLIIIVIFTMLVVFLLKTSYNKEKLELKNEFLLANEKNYESIVEDYKELRHNLTHDLLAIRSIAEGDAHSLIDETIKKYHTDYNWLTTVGNVPKGLQAILYLKLYEMKNRNINIDVDIDALEEYSLEFSKRKYILICEVLGIILDNAIEAAEISEGKSIFINMKNESQFLNIRIMNTFNNNLNLNMIGKKDYSTKQIKSGIGLHFITKNAKKSMDIKKEIINNVFIVSLKIPIKEKLFN